MANTYNKDHKEIALYNTQRSLGKKFNESKSNEDYEVWQKALKEYFNYKWKNK